MQYRTPEQSTIDDLLALELQGFPPDEAAPKETILYRLSNAPELFLAGYDQDDSLVCMINGTAIAGEVLTHEAMYEHDPFGRTYCIHSVVVAKQHWRKGLGSKLLVHMLEKIKQETCINLVLLLCKGHLINFYKQAGFVLVGESNVDHGADQWFEMRLDINK
eukprot:TRINITY_DN1543_c0_g1_i3.p1 TRINITY_DN1543_c0_g1~~TRINITY_DN1543_c0_g1_i3.p1  ORF type:complete len:162 (+),score=32.91 TRINITY_DN1543_c0_g1_i3:25-510(+)